VTPFAVRRLTVEDLPRLRQFWNEHWSGDFIVTRGTIHQAGQVHGFVVEDADGWAGLITFKIAADECEVISLDGLRAGEGIGTILLRTVIEEAREHDCKRLFLITTNDNLYALGFYQRRDFEIAAVHRGAVNESRKIKPGLPEIGLNHIPLRDEIELEMIL
jgi:ribosomal protein S18 acetylase RimI-like enzyme